jgi:hypothetical protein
VSGIAAKAISERRPNVVVSMLKSRAEAVRAAAAPVSVKPF